jgi:L-iditol 2-dehydrogenase
VDRNAHRLTKTKELGADLTVDASARDPVTSILEWTNGRGVDFTVDAVGTAQCRENSIACTATGGAVICIGLEDEICAVNTRPIVTREVDLRGAYAYTRPDFAEALSMLECNSYRRSHWSLRLLSRRDSPSSTIWPAAIPRF